MYLQNELKSIAKRLFEEGICRQPLDDRSLDIIYRYMGNDDTGADLMRRLSDIEVSREEMTDEADDAVSSVKEFLTGCESILKLLIDDWSKRGLINNYSLSVSKAYLSAIYHSYSMVSNELASKLSILGSTSALLAETAVLLKACSASYLEIHNETRLSYYAASLNRNKDGVLSCKAIAMQARDSASECDRDAARYLSVAKSSDKALSVINTTLSESYAFFENAAGSKNINASSLVNVIIRGIESLKNIISSIK